MIAEMARANAVESWGGVGGGVANTTAAAFCPLIGGLFLSSYQQRPALTLCTTTGGGRGGGQVLPSHQLARSSGPPNGQPWKTPGEYSHDEMSKLSLSSKYSLPSHSTTQGE